MLTTSSESSIRKKMGSNKIVLGFAALAATAVIGVTGVAAAATPNTMAAKPSHQACDNAGFRNYGQCVKEWAQHKNAPGSGYGGGNSVGVTLNVSGSNNIINIIINFFR